METKGSRIPQVETETSLNPQMGTQRRRSAELLTERSGIVQMNARRRSSPMVTERRGSIGYIHHHDEGYSELSLFQRNVLDIVMPNVTAAIEGSLDRIPNGTPFVVVDYGAADGLNSVPMIKKCAGLLSPEVSDLIWIFNDLFELDESIVLSAVRARMNNLSGYKKDMVKLQFLSGDFHTQVAPADSVDLGVSVSAVHWLSNPPPQGCSLDPRYPDEITRRIAAKDWVDFLQCRAKELKEGGRLTLAVYVTSDNSPVRRTDKELITVAPQRVITDMFYEGIITKEEFEYARTFPFTFRTEADLRAPFLDPESDLSQSLNLMGITTRDTPDPFYPKWVDAGGEKNAAATEEFITNHVDSVKSFYNSLWTILEVTRSLEDNFEILETFYRRVGKMVRANLEGYHASATVAVVDVIKV